MLNVVIGVVQESKAEFVVMICGDVMTMPGLPKAPSAVSSAAGAGAD